MLEYSSCFLRIKGSDRETNEVHFHYVSFSLSISKDFLLKYFKLCGNNTNTDENRKSIRHNLLIAGVWSR